MDMVHYRCSRPLAVACAISVVAACCVSNIILVSSIHCLATARGAPCSKFMYFNVCEKSPLSIQYLNENEIETKNIKYYLVINANRYPFCSLLCYIKTLFKVTFEIQFNP